MAVLCQFLREVDYMTAFKALQEQNRWDAAPETPLSRFFTSFFFFNFCLWLFFSHDAMDSFYDYIWDVTILEYLTCILTLPGL